MPKRSSVPQLKDEKLYERLRDEGASKEKAARISNAAAKEGRSKLGKRGGEAEDYEERTVSQLRGRAKELGLTGYSKLRRAELIRLLREH
ncbi:Rho termination factor N-terminal domain-containing protein [Pseudoclavibacter sp. CFCC 11306]|uniref:DUF7218 family protein n=1 Tax=Pseudoclavibacter sp. CFCC 11306 TaxID=1564493 RepID=UPI0013012698|nr:Rho termination factor N-terminal domain-containing protein [Pseudoclavibacter sp. CFCC 11306]KAB1658124.1 Rho termination factor [Pseudoclavibacter sp. CFCC 11306]